MVIKRWEVRLVICKISHPVPFLFTSRTISFKLQPNIPELPVHAIRLFFMAIAEILITEPISGFTLILVYYYTQPIWCHLDHWYPFYGLYEGKIKLKKCMNCRGKRLLWRPYLALYFSCVFGSTYNWHQPATLKFELIGCYYWCCTIEAIPPHPPPPRPVGRQRYRLRYRQLVFLITGWVDAATIIRGLAGAFIGNLLATLSHGIDLIDSPWFFFQRFFVNLWFVLFFFVGVYLFLLCCRVILYVSETQFMLDWVLDLFKEMPEITSFVHALSVHLTLVLFDTLICV